MDTRQLSVFSGGFTLEAAGAVAADAGQPEEVLPLVSQLADKSLIVAAEDLAGDREDGTGDRFRMLETIRDYAGARLRTATERGRDSDPGLRARALGAQAQVASLALDLPVAFTAGTEALAVLRQLDHLGGPTARQVQNRVVVQPEGDA